MLGAGLAGLEVAAVLAQRFGRVTIVERDALGETGRARKGVPQGRHVHALMPAGLRRLVELFPGILEELREQLHQRVPKAKAAGDVGLADEVEFQQLVQRVECRGLGNRRGGRRELGFERVWALEDCRHVSGSFERFVIERGERVLRVTTKLMADSRRHARGRGKSDSIGAIAVARRRCAKAWMPCRRRSWTAPNSICGCSWTIASGWSASGLRSTTRCNGICTTAGPNCDCRAARCSTATGPARRPAARAAEQTTSLPTTPSCADDAVSPKRSARSATTSSLPTIGDGPGRPTFRQH